LFVYNVRDCKKTKIVVFREFFKQIFNALRDQVHDYMAKYTISELGVLLPYINYTCDFLFSIYCYFCIYCIYVNLKNDVLLI